MVLHGGPQDIQNEDVLQECVLGRPSVNQHYAVFSKPSDPFFIRWLALRDAFYQHGWQFPQFIKHAWTGGSLGVFFGFYHYMSQTHMEPLLFNKAQHFSKRAGLFGPALIVGKAVAPFVSIGALLGMAYHGFFNVLLQQDHEYTLFKSVAGHTLFCGVVGGAYNLRFFWFSALIGLFYGFLHYESSQGYMPYISKSDPGFFYELPGLTKEQRDVYKNRDKITYLSIQPEFQYSKNLDHI